MSKKSAKKKGQGKNSAGMRVLKRLTVHGADLSDAVPSVVPMVLDVADTQRLIACSSVTLRLHERPGLFSYDYAALSSVGMKHCFGWLTAFADSSDIGGLALLVGDGVEHLGDLVASTYAVRGLPAAAKDWGLEELIACLALLAACSWAFRTEVLR